MILRLCLLSPHRERRCQSTACALWHERIKDWQVMARSGLRATPFLDNKKAGSNAVEIIRGLPRPSQMLPHLPEANRVGTGKEASGGMPPEPPGDRPTFFLGKSAGTWIPEPTILDKGLRSKFVSRQSGFYPIFLGSAAPFTPPLRPDAAFE